VKQGGRRSGPSCPHAHDVGGGTVTGVGPTRRLGKVWTLSSFRCGSGCDAGFPACVSPGRLQSLHHNGRGGVVSGALVRQSVVEPPHCIDHPPAGLGVGRATEGPTNAKVGRRVTLLHAIP